MKPSTRKKVVVVLAVAVAITGGLFFYFLQPHYSKRTNFAVKRLFAKISEFQLSFNLHVEIPPRKEQVPWCIAFLVPSSQDVDHPPKGAILISPREAKKIINYLAASGFFDHALDYDVDPIPVPAKPRPGPYYFVEARAGDRPLFRGGLYNLGSDYQKHLDWFRGLRKVLEGDAAKTMDEFLKNMEHGHEQWNYWLEHPNRAPR